MSCSDPRLMTRSEPATPRHGLADRGTLGRIEGVHQKQQSIDDVLAPFGARFTESEPFRPVTIRAIYADDDTVIVVWDGRDHQRRAAL
jgi:hypothetical protein